MPGRSGTVRDSGLPAASREVFRLTTPVAVWWVWVAFVVANVIDLAVQGSKAHSAFVISAVLLLITGLAYALALRPRVVADQAGLDIVNPFRDYHVPWPVIQLIDAGDWVRVHHTRDSSPVVKGPVVKGPVVNSTEVPGRAVECWALYVSARAKRRDARPTPSRTGGFGAFSAYAKQLEASETTRAPAEARYLASLPPAKAIAVRLDTRAAKERARAASGRGGKTAKSSQAGRPDQAGQASLVTVRWAWLPLAAIAGPAVILLVALLT